MYATLHQSTEPSGNDRTVETLWHRALTESTPEAREAAAWEVFLAAEPGVTGLPAFKEYELPAEVRPLLTIARERALGRPPLDPLYSMRWDADPEVQDATARALVRLTSYGGDWEKTKASELLVPLRTGRTRLAVEEALDDFSIGDTRAMLRRVLGDRIEDSVWVWPVGIGILLVVTLTLAFLGFYYRHPFAIWGITPLILLLGRFLWRPGGHTSDWSRSRMLTLLTRIEEQAEKEPEALREALPKLRALSWRISNEPDEVRAAAARLVQRLEAAERDAQQLPIASKQPLRQTDELPLPAATRGSEAGTDRE